MKVYFMPRVRAFVTKESPEEMMTRLTSRLGLDKPWAKITQFLSRLLPGDKPEIEIAAIDCASGAQNRLKIYFRTDLLSYSHMEYLLTLGGSLATADVSTVRVLWAALTDGTPAGSSRYFRSGLIYYELRPDQDSPSIFRFNDIFQMIWPSRRLSQDSITFLAFPQLTRTLVLRKQSCE
jgi:DMATS type aromatic prenyltransferase